MIAGVHTIFYSTHAEGVRSFFRDVLKFPHVDAGHGWLIFAAPPGEIAVHPADEPGPPELYLMCTDIKATIAELERSRVYRAGERTTVGTGDSLEITGRREARLVRAAAQNGDQDEKRRRQKAVQGEKRRRKKEGDLTLADH